MYTGFKPPFLEEYLISPRCRRAYIAVLDADVIMKYFLSIFDPRTRRSNNELGDRELGQIADYMYEWEGRIAEELELTVAEVAGVKTKHPKELKLQQ